MLDRGQLTKEQGEQLRVYGHEAMALLFAAGTATCKVMNEAAQMGQIIEHFAIQALFGQIEECWERELSVAEAVAYIENLTTDTEAEVAHKVLLNMPLPPNARSH